MKHEGFKNYSTWSIAMVIDNDQALNKKMLEGLTVCARRFSGFNPKASSYPFITMDAPVKDHMKDDVMIENPARLAKALKDGHSRLAECVFGLRLEKFFVEKSKGVLGEDEHFKMDDVDRKEIAEHFVSKHWATVLESILTRKRRDPEGIEP